jgi:hypothetical protein
VSFVQYAAVDSRLARGEPKQLATVVIPMTAAKMSRPLEAFPRCEMEPGRSIAVVREQVSAFSTLSEMRPNEVEAAYWLGYNLGLLYADAIECARSVAADPWRHCAPPPTSEVTRCRSLADLLPQR